MGFGVYFILESNVPEFLEFLGGIEIGSSSASDSEDSAASRSASATPAFSGDFGDSSAADSMGGGPALATKPRVKDGKYGDHLMVENIAIKNEPKLMAEAIRTMMAKDDDAGT